MLSEFDYKIKNSILGVDYKSALKYLINFKSCISTLGQKVVFNSLIELYSKNAILNNIQDLTFDLPKVIPKINNNSEIPLRIKSNLHSESKILMILPKYSSKSAGIRSLYKLYEVLNRNHFEVDLFIFYESEDLELELSNLIKNKKIVIMPEIISHLPYLPQKIFIYKGAEFSRFSKIKLGSTKIKTEDCITLNHFEHDDSDLNVPLTISIINYDLFKPTIETSLGGTGIYLGKFEMNQNHKKFLYKIAKDFSTSLIITRNWPESYVLPYLFQQLDLLITLDPLSSTNLEFSLTGSPVLFHPEVLVAEDRNLIENHFQANKNFRFDLKDIQKLTFEESSKIHREIHSISLETEKIHIEKLKNLISHHLLI